MRQTVITLEKFYASSLGQAALDMAMRRLKALWPDLSGRDVLGFGYCGPYLNNYMRTANRVVLAMPGGQGAVASTSSRGIIACLTEEYSLPFSDARFDYVLCVHGAEEAPDLPVLLRELWRVTRPEGRIVVIASNRSGMWARSDQSPFGAGRPFSRTQLRGALNDAGFVPSVWSGALYVPPIRKLINPELTRGCERFGETVWPKFSGLVLVEAVKRLYAEPKGHAKKLVMRPNFNAKPIVNRSGINRTEANRIKHE